MYWSVHRLRSRKNRPKRSEARQDCSNSLLTFRRLHDPVLPATAAENQRAHDCECRESDRNREEYAVGSHVQPDTQEITERDLPQPENKQVDDGWRPRVARAVERLPEYHAVGVEQETVSDDAQTVCAEMCDLWRRAKEGDYLWREQHKD